jgi:hypothetical protein
MKLPSKQDSKIVWVLKVLYIVAIFIAMLLTPYWAKADGVTTIPGPDGFDQIVVATDGPNFLAYTIPSDYPGYPDAWQICDYYTNGPLSGEGGCNEPFSLNFVTPTIEFFSSILTGAEVEIVDPSGGFITSLSAETSTLATPEPSTIWLVGICALLLAIAYRRRYKPSERTEWDPW